MRTLRSRALRFGILLGIVIGVASVVTLLDLGNGTRREVLASISAMGTNLLLIRPGAPNQRFDGGFRATLSSGIRQIGFLLIPASVLLAVLSVPLGVGISALELIVILVQAYVFTLLTAVFIGMAIHAHH